MHCPECESQQIVKNGKVTLQGGAVVQKYVCKACRKQFNDRTGTPMARLRTPSAIVTLAMNVRTLRNGGASDWTVLWQISLHDSPLLRTVWQTNSANGRLPRPRQQSSRSKEMRSILGWARTFPPCESEGWTLTSIERDTRYWLTAQAGRKDGQLFEQGVNSSWQWANNCEFIRCFSDGERRYAQELWKLALCQAQISRSLCTISASKSLERGAGSSH
jgi:hypothetical protein